MKLMDYIKNPWNIVRFARNHHFMDVLPDSIFLKLVYRQELGRKLNLKNPKTFNEKLQWLKLYNRKPDYTQMVEKFEAKKYVSKRIGEKYIVPTLGVWEKFEEINFESLPDQFVLKCTHDSGGLVICRDKSNFDKEAARQKIERSLKNNYYLHGREWPYKDVKPRIIAEQYLDDSIGQDKCEENVRKRPKGMTDYKFFCFGGKAEFLYVSRGFEDHATTQVSFITMNWELAPFRRTDYAQFEYLPPKPQGFEEMIRLSEELSKDIPFLRVDWYQVGEKVYFSELTFFPCNGIMRVEPAEWDRICGDKIKLPNVQVR